MFTFEGDVNITKELLLSKHTQETYMEHYLGVPVKKGLFCSPSVIRKDRNPTCSFYKNKSGVLKFKDFAGPTFDFVGAVMHIFNCSYYKALRIIANDFGFIDIYENKNPPLINYTYTEFVETKSANIRIEAKDFTSTELDWWKTFGVTLKTLKKFKVFSVKSVFLNEHYFTSSAAHNPIFGYFGGKNSHNDELWKIYFPNKLKYRFLTNYSASFIQGAKQLPTTGEFIVVTKSLKDVMSLYEFGIPSVAPNSENLFLSNAQYQKIQMKFKEVYLLYDFDLPGIKASKRIRKNFSNIKVLLIPKRYKCKDFSDFVKKYGLLKSFELIESFKTYYLKNSE
jgi:5S rRNA maturation endonuclease (ribonuclease M5)